MKKIIISANSKNYLVSKASILSDWEILIFPSSGKEANTLAEELCAFLLDKFRDLKCKVTTPSLNNRSGITKRLIILVGDGSPFSFGNITYNKNSDIVLPVFSSEKKKGLKLEKPYSTFNAFFWKLSIREAVFTIFGKIGLWDEDLKIFISYRRDDTSALAIQLFDRLNHEGFEVFLDQFSIEPMVNFQERLSQDLADKAMVVILESKTYLESKWVQYELDYIRINRLGYYILNIDKAPPSPSLDEDKRRMITSLKDLNTKLLLKPNVLDEVIGKIRESHGESLFLMKCYLQQSILDKFPGAVLEEDGFIGITFSNSNQYNVWPVLRPPRVNDYHYVNTKTKNKPVIIGPSFIESSRAEINSWLSGKSAIDFIEETNLSKLSSL